MRDTLVIGVTVEVIGMVVGTIYASGIGQHFAKIIGGLRRLNDGTPAEEKASGQQAESSTGF
nr:hypothetical protein [Oscillochloris trichoides]